MLFVQHNLLAQNANRQLNVNSKKNTKTTEKLSSGYRINRAADDAAGLSISEKMRRQVRGLHQTVDNISEGIGYVQTAEGALNEVQDMLQRINELAVKAANGTNTNEDRMAIDREIQQLKNEMNRIFSETTFNERKIWEPNDRKLLGTFPRQTAEYVNTNASIKVTNENCGVVAYGSYSIVANEADGIKISWTGYDGNGYSTVPISWEELKQNQYRFDMGDYFGNPDDPLDPDKPDGPKRELLYDENGKPVFRHQVAFTPQTDDISEIIKCIDGTSFYGSASADMEGVFENNKGEMVSPQPSATIYSVSLNYGAAFASNHNTGKDSSTSVNIHDFNGEDDKFLEPTNASGTLVQTLPSGGNLTRVPSNGTNNVNIARDSTDTWEFSFYMDGIGTVKGTSSSISYCAPNDKADDDGPSNPTINERVSGLWWSWVEEYKNGKWVLTDRKTSNTISCNEKGAGTLGSFMQTLTGKKKTGSPGLLSPANGGDADGGGYIDIGFSLTSENEFEYGNGQKNKNVGSFTLRINVSNTDTEQEVLNKVNGALNSNTILDFYVPKNASTSSYYGSASFGTAYAKRQTIDVPIYGGICGFYVQAGTEGGQHIEVKYEALSTIALGMQHTNVRTAESAQRAINEVKGALQMVSEQRSTFGAYQNRIEHAQNINANVEENTQAAESLIRDTDIADAMMEFSINNILMQAGTSMLTQANQSSQSILELLQ